jgi:hypothetical protein
VGSPCHTAHIKSMSQFLPYFLQQLFLYGLYRCDDPLPSFLKITRQGWPVRRRRPSRTPRERSRTGHGDLAGLTPSDFFLWGYVKDAIYRPPLPRDLQELRQRIITAVTAIQEELLEEVWRELAHRLDVCRVTRAAQMERLQLRKV